MRITVNQVEYDLPSQSMIADALKIINAKPPFAVAVNLNFVPKSQYSVHALNENDQIEVIAPVTGG
ncbi:sulfur carrier protein ThiS [Polynucleobacter sp. MWH-UH25E]|uniref:sulfur carrier protein ThiS n=1 Tax=Polynucleobacter sp. MWH-UH25E TaxID=1855616 RepID=UPI001BFE8473|nr:sulfur carrier protein ThiS [Polynucleobacter sp. MWH-UH25E]QWD61621.1 sulfur carrier protein ThiS [Polynucleobacter sp. MWH-UH25E]